MIHLWLARNLIWLALPYVDKFRITINYNTIQEGIEITEIFNECGEKRNLQPKFVLELVAEFRGKAAGH